MKKLENVIKSIVAELNAYIRDIRREQGLKADEFLKVDTKASSNTARYFCIGGTINAKCGEVIRYHNRGGKYTLNELCNY